MATSPNGSAAIPVSEQDSGTIQGGPAIPVYQANDAAIRGGAALPVHIVSQADVDSGTYRVAGGIPQPIAFVEDGRSVLGQAAIPVYVVNPEEPEGSSYLFADSFARADSPSNPGSGWVASNCTAGIASGALYIANGSGFQLVMHEQTAHDVYIVWDLFMPATLRNAGVVVHADSVNNPQNYIRIFTNGNNSIFIHATQNRGYLDSIYSTAHTWTLNAWNHVEIWLVGNQYRIAIDGQDKMFGGWTVDASNYYVNQTHIGAYCQDDSDSGVRWDNLTVAAYTL